MDTPHSHLANEQEVSTPSQQLSAHLLHYPYDIIDVSRLLRRFHASVTDFHQALRQVEHSESTS